MNKADIIGYANGNFGKQILFGTLEVALLFYMTEILGVNPLLAGTIIFISLLIDALLDPVIGLLIDKLSIRYGVYILTGSIAYSGLFILLFSLPLLGYSEVGIICAILFAIRASYTLIDVPHNALVAKLVNDADKRTSVTAWRFLFSSLSTLILSLSIAPILSGETVDLEAMNFFYYAVIVAFLSLVSLLVVARVSLKNEKMVERKTFFEKKKVNFSPKSLLGNYYFLILIVVFFATGLFVPILSKGMLYYSKYYLNNETLSGVFLTIIVVGQIVSLPFWVKLSTKLEKKTTLALGHALLIVACTGIYLCGKEAAALLYGLFFLVGTANGVIYMIIWSLLADVVDYQQAKTGLRPEAIIFSLSIMIMKIALGLGTMILGLLLEYSGYSSSSSVSDATGELIPVITCLLPVVGSVICITFLCSYKLSKNRQKEIQSIIRS